MSLINPFNLLESLKAQDSHVYKEIFEENVYCVAPQELQDKGLLDIGGHYGMFTIYGVIAGTKQTITVEANQSNLIKCLNNTKDTNVKVINAAVSSQKDTILNINNEGGCSTLSTGEQLVATITLETLIKQFDSNLPLVLKMDIEGAEYDILYNTDPENIKRFSLILMEAHNHNPTERGNEAEKLKEYILSLGFNIGFLGIYFTDAFPDLSDKTYIPYAYSYKFIKN